MIKDRTLRSNVAPAFAIVVAVVAFAVPHRAASQTPASQPTTAAAPSVGPIAYYTASCARCHGEISAPYLGLDHPKRGPALKDAIDMMASGPAAAPLDDDGLKQQTAMHEAIFGKGPFVWLDPADATAGEVLPGTTLVFESAGPPEPVAVADNRFIVPPRPGTLVATREKSVVRVPVRAKQ